MSQAGGEKELVLGNKQLISLFFVVVALCGVFFAMGYMVRGNSLKGTVASAGDTTTAAPAPGDPMKRQQPEPPAETSAENAPPASTDTPPTETHPAQDTASAAPPQSEGPKPQPSRIEPLKPDDSAPAVAAVEAGASYVQVGALARQDAEATVRTLREQHLPALLAASSREGLYRVLVGPYRLTSDVADAKARLKSLGFSDTIVQKQ